MIAETLVIVTTTFADKTTATAVAQASINASLAACAQIDGPIESHYRWNGQVCCDQEWRLSLKTTANALTPLKQLVDSLHPYQLPQWIVTPVIDASDLYCQWVIQSVAAAKHDVA